MTVLTCAATERRLDGFVDGELPIAEQIAVSAHLDWCEPCAATVADLRTVGAALHAIAPGRAFPTHEEAAGFRSSVVSRLSAERDASLAAQVRLMFDDPHVLYAGLAPRSLRPSAWC